MTKSSPAKLANIRIKRSKSMTQSLAVYEDIRKNINFIDEIQHQDTNEALGDLVKKAQTYWSKKKTGWAGREKRAGQRAGRRELEHYVNQNFKWLGLLMGRQNIDWTELSFGNMRHFFKAPSNRIGLDDADVDKVFAKVQKQFNIPNIKNNVNINDDALTSQAIVKGLLKQGIVQAQAKQGLGDGSQKEPAASTTANAPAAAAGSPAASPASASSNTTSATSTSPAVPAAAPAAQQDQKPFDPQKPDLVVDIKGQPTKVWKVPVTPQAPSGWVYWNPVDKVWVKPPAGSKDADWFNDYYAAKQVKEGVSPQGPAGAHTEDLVAAQQAEQQGDKALQYEKLADYHEKFSKINKLKPADRVHHITQAGIYRSAAQAVRSAQETLAKSSK
jgi:hypothetical protein